MEQVLVESPTLELYKYWLTKQPYISKYLRINSEVALDGYHGEVVVLNGGSMDPYIRSKVRRLEVAGQLTVSRRTV